MEDQQHTDEPYRAAWRGAGGDRLPPERRKADIGVLPQLDGVIRDRDDRERGYGEGQAEPQQAIAKKGGGRFMRKAWPDEQSGQKKENRTEEAVGGPNHPVKAEHELEMGST